MTSGLPIIQKTYDLVKWYVPILNRLPKYHRFLLGDRIITGLYGLLDGLIIARYSPKKLVQLESLNYQFYGVHVAEANKFLVILVMLVYQVHI